MKNQSGLFWSVIIFGTPILIFFGLSYVFGISMTFCFVSFPTGFLIWYLYDKFSYRFREPTEKLGKSEGREETGAKQVSGEKYSVEKRSSKKDRSIFSRLFGGEEKCEKCGSELVYREGADSYYCEECEEYKWK